jgi:Coenzyme PQQ synthesis protein D (PqqD)
MISSNDRIRRMPEPFFSRVDDELLGLDTRAGLAYSLNQPAGRVWELLAEWTTLPTICDELEHEYKVNHETCSSEVVDLLGRLRDAGLVEVEGAVPR